MPPDRLVKLYQTEIADHRPTSLLDDGAFVRVADHEVMTGNYDGGDSAFQSDTERDLQLRAESMIGPDGQVLDELDAATMFQELRRRDRADLVTTVSLSPPSAAHALLGGSALCQPGDPTTLAGRLQQVVFWAGDDLESTPCTITLGQVKAPVVSGGGSVKIRPVARVTWGTRTASYSVDLDIGTGAQLTVCASSVYVSCYLDVGSTQATELCASLGFYSSTPRNPATRTIYFDGLGTSSPVSTPRPTYSNQILNVTRSVNGAALTLRFFDSSGAVIGVQTILANTALASPIVLPNDCTLVDLATDTPCDARRPPKL